MRVAALVPVRRFLRGLGAPVDRLAERLHLPPDIFARPEELIPAYTGSRFIAEGARAEGIEILGALAGERTRLDDLGSFGHQVLQSATLYDAITTAQRIVRSYHSGEAYWLGGVGADRWFCQRFTTQLDDWLEQTEQYALLTALAVFRAVGGPRWRPTVHLRHGVPKSIRDTPMLHDADLIFDRPVSAIAAPPALLHRSLVALRNGAHGDEADLAAWNASGPASDLANSLRQWMRGIIRTEAVRIEVLAETIGARPRTLQRRLAEAGTSYARILALARFEAASQLLTREDIPIRDVAREVGYRDAAHLTRAFRRWSGTTPSDFRRLHRERDMGSPLALEPSAPLL